MQAWVGEVLKHEGLNLVQAQLHAEGGSDLGEAGGGRQARGSRDLSMFIFFHSFILDLKEIVYRNKVIEMKTCKLP